VARGCGIYLPFRTNFRAANLGRAACLPPRNPTYRMQKLTEEGSTSSREQTMNKVGREESVDHTFVRLFL
jgi:hypothetical protein